MNYANLIEDAKLKKTFIVATLVSTVIGTFQAASTLHDKLEEKRERRAKQGELDSKQNKALKDLQEKLRQLEESDKNDGEGGKGGGDQNDANNGRDDNDKKRSNRSRTRSRSRTREGYRDGLRDGYRDRSRERRRRLSREDLEDNMDFADSARRSQAMIERTYHDHLQRLGPAYAQGDMITENALQAQTIRLQQTVIGILQEAATTGRGLSREDLGRLIVAQDNARDASLRALQGQYDRIAYGKHATGLIREAPVEVATYRHEPAQLAIEPARRSLIATSREPAVLARVPVEEDAHHSSIVPPPPPEAVQREFARLALGKTSSRRSPKGSLSPPPASTAIATIDAKVTPANVDRVFEHQQRRLRASSPTSRRKSSSLVTQSPKTVVPERKVASLVNSAPSIMDKREGTSTIKTTATQVNGRPTAELKTKSALIRDLDGPLRPALPDIAARNSTSLVAQAQKTPKQSQPTTVQKSALKGLPTSSPHELFCNYSLDLQSSHRPLNNAFRPSGDHRCPACRVRIPVDTRDVWVLSTHFPGREENRQKVREYRMDGRFVIKCHTAEGGFACVLCEKFRDMDCLCKSVEALVKHLGTAHTPDEFECDPDLVRMKEGSMVGVKSREMVYV